MKRSLYNKQDYCIYTTEFSNPKYSNIHSSHSFRFILIFIFSPSPPLSPLRKKKNEQKLPAVIHVIVIQPSNLKLKPYFKKPPNQSWCCFIYDITFHQSPFQKLKLNPCSGAAIQKYTSPIITCHLKKKFVIYKLLGTSIQTYIMLIVL